MPAALEDSEDSIFLVLDVDGDQAQAVCAQGAQWALEGVDTPSPTLVMQDGTRLACKYEHSMGTNLVFAADDSGEQRVLCATDAVLRATPPEGASRVSGPSATKRAAAGGKASKGPRAKAGAGAAKAAPATAAGSDAPTPERPTDAGAATAQ